MATQLRITGRVQGVGYRAWFASRARTLGLSGWVRNRLDGSVEALVDGDAAAVHQIIDAARQGPGMARVDDITVASVADSAGPGFEVLATA